MNSFILLLVLALLLVVVVLLLLLLLRSLLFLLPQRTTIPALGAKDDWISGSLIWSKTLLELIFNPCGEFRKSRKPIQPIHSPHLHVRVPVIFSDLWSVQMLKRDWGAESNGKLPHLFIPSKTATSIPVFAVENLPLGRTVALVPEV